MSTTSSSLPTTSSQRLAKAIAHSGLCSRRDAEKLIISGAVTVDGLCVLTPATNVTAAQTITVHGKPLKAPSQIQLYKFYKPKGVLTTKRDPQNRKTLYDLLPPHLQHLIYVGRLDYQSEGLLLLTNNGDFSRKLEHPSTGLSRTYRVRAYGTLDTKQLQQLAKGVTIEGIHYAPFSVTVEHSGLTNHWLVMTLTEGKNREIRILLESINLTVNRLIRTQYGPVTLGTLAIGKLEQIHNPEWVFNQNL